MQVIDGHADAAYTDGHRSRLFPQHREALLERGLTLATIAAAGLRSAAAQEVADILGFNPHSGGIVIPYRHPFTGETVLSRVRPDTPPLVNGKPAKYLSPKGAGNHCYFPPHCTTLLRSPTAPIGLTEGEFKTLWAYQAGLFYVGLTGVYGFRGKNARGETGPIADLDLILWDDRIVTITYDSDVAANEKVRGAREAFAKEAYRRGARTTYGIDVPELNGEKTGMDDYLAAEGVEAFLDLDADEIPSPYPRIKLWTGVELQQAVMERPPAVVKGWGIRQGGKVMICGRGGNGKSTLVLQWICHLSAGSPILGHPALEVADPQRVAIYMAEDPLSEVKFRWERQMRELGYGSEVAEKIAFLAPPGAKLKLTDECARTALFDALRRHRATVAILDPLVGLHDAEENSNSAMRGVLDLLAPFQEETGCTFIIVHHEPKAPDGNGTAARGASAIRDWCRTMLRLIPQGPGDNGTQRFKLDLDKANYGGHVWSLTLERKRDSYLFTPITLEASVTPQDVWELVGAEGMWLEELKQNVTERWGVSEVTARRLIKKAEECRLVSTVSRTNPATGREKSYATRESGGESD